ncbi:MAG: glycosyltransferase family 2 protein [Phycisphaerae bacterium]
MPDNSVRLASIVIPVYNEAASVRRVLDRVCALRIPGAELEIIVVNDGSTDQTAEILDAYEFPPRVCGRVHHAPANLGKGAAMRTGIALAAGDAIAFQDGDLELDPDDLPALLEPVISGKAPVVFGSRFLAGYSRGVPLQTRWGNWFLTLATNVLFGARLTDMACGYKVLSRATAQSVRLRTVGFEIEPEITAKLCRLGIPIHELPVRYQPRTVAEGKKIRARDGLQYLRTLIAIRFASRTACERPPAPPRQREIRRASMPTHALPTFNSDSREAVAARHVDAIPRSRA